MDETAAAAASLERYAAGMGYTQVALGASVLRALATPTAADRLERFCEVLARAKPEGYVRTFLDLGAPMVAALREAAARGIAPGYVSCLLDAHGNGSVQTESEPAAQDALVEPLSEREIEVLHLLSTGRTYQEIATAISVSLNTVKTHLKHIYAKLGVRNRRAAAARAEELGLVP
jgi:LuxR family maltose regulon positive regulatory protein